MSVPLKELRFGAPETVHLWLDAEAAAFGKDKNEIARAILLEWARKKAHAYKVATKRMQANGMQPELFGDDPDDAGAQREDAGRSRSEPEQAPRRGRV